MLSSVPQPANQMPATLGEVIQDDLPGYQLKIGYWLELHHGAWGTFPAIFVSDPDPKRLVLVLDRALAEKVWRTLPPRRSKINETLWYVNETEGIAFTVMGRSLAEIEQHRPCPILTSQEFHRCLAQSECPFKWAPGLVGEDMSQEEFLETLDAAMKKLEAA